MRIENEFQVASPPDDAWRILTDVERVAPCLPGARVIGAIDGDTYQGTMRVKLGPVGVEFLGELRFTERDHAARVARATASAREARNRGSVDADLVFVLEPSGPGTRARITTDLTLVGPVAQYGRGAGVVQKLSQMLIGRFARCLEQQILKISGDTAEGA